MKFLLYFAITITAIFVVKLLLVLFGFDHDVDVDADIEIDGVFDSLDGVGEVPDVDGIELESVELDADSSFLVFTLDSVLAFLMVFSWSTLFFLQEMYFPPIISILTGIILGIIVMVLYSFLLSKIRKLDTPEVEDVFPKVGAEGSMYLGSKNGRGQAKFSVNGKFIIYDVYTNSEKIQTGDRVTVQTVKDKMVTVIKLEEE